VSAGHHSIMHHKKHNLWFIVYHQIPIGETAANNHVTCIKPLYFDENDFIRPVQLSFIAEVKQQTLK